MSFFFFFKQKTAYEISACLVGSEMCIRDRSWAQELCIYMFVWMAKFGAAYGVRTGIHVGVDVMINRLPGATRKAYVLFGLLAGAAFTGIVGTLGATFTWDIAHTC